MPSKKAIKRRFTSVTATKKIIKAMNMVAATKLRRDKARLMAHIPFFQNSRQIVDQLVRRGDAAHHAFLQLRAVRHTAYLVITGNRGLCGSYNADLLSAALAHMDGGTGEKIITIGSKGYDFFARRGKLILRRYDDVLETMFYEDAERIAGDVAALYASGEADEVYVAYTRFESVLARTPRVDRLLPIGGGADAPRGADAMIYDPDISVYLDHAIPIYLSAFLQNALLESSACEQSARMISMDAAENNASDIIVKLTRGYKRRRQIEITQEISELMSSLSILE
jgi:F-type H+-transporting ATPase subunit gamma